MTIYYEPRITIAVGGAPPVVETYVIRRLVCMWLAVVGPR